MSTYTPGMEISGGSLGHGLGVAVGMALGLRFQGKTARVINMMSDGELDEGSTWEAAMAAAHHGLGNLLCVVDMNGLQADGPTAGVLRIEPVRRQVGGLRVAHRPRRRQRHQRPGRRFRLRPGRRHARGGHLRHPHRARCAVPGDPGEGALHPHRRTRMGPRPPGAARRQPRWEQLT